MKRTRKPAPARRHSIAGLIATGKPLPLPGVYDALSARLAERAGFQAAFVSGYSLSATALGEPDFGFIGHAEIVDAARRICASVTIPVIVDIDTGYGNAFNVERVVRDLINVGAAGCFLEDQVWPKRCGHMEGKKVVPLEEYLPKLRAALAARGKAPFHITARTDARAAVGLDEAIRRGQAFAEAGADAVFIEAPQSAAEMARIRKSISRQVPLVANMVENGKTPLQPYKRLHKSGYQIVVMPVAGLLAAAKALQDVYGTLAKKGVTSAFARRMLTFQEMNGLTGLPERYRREKEWA